LGLSSHLMSELGEMPRQLERSIRSIPTTHLRWKPTSWAGSPGETFSALEHACHLRDIEKDGYQVRIRRLLEEEYPSLLSIDGYALAAERDYPAAELEAVLKSFREARHATLDVLRSLSDDQLARTGVFAEYGHVTLRALAHFLRSHDQQHLACVHWLIGKMASASPP
jgi:hypothetical protein